MHLVAGRYRAFDRGGRVVFTLAFRGMFAGLVAVREGIGLETAGRIRAPVAACRPLASCSERASSCFMISAFSHFSARLGLRLPSGVSRNSAAAVSTPRAIRTVDEIPNMPRSSLDEWAGAVLLGKHFPSRGHERDRLPRLLARPITYHPVIDDSGSRLPIFRNQMSVEWRASAVVPQRFLRGWWTDWVGGSSSGGGGAPGTSSGSNGVTAAGLIPTSVIL
jgi:hypothetical protein